MTGDLFDTPAATPHRTPTKGEVAVRLRALADKYPGDAAYWLDLAERVEVPKWRRGGEPDTGNDP
jgi:hypothetical protein